MNNRGCFVCWIAFLFMGLAFGVAPVLVLLNTESCNFYSISMAWVFLVMGLVILLGNIKEFEKLTMRIRLWLNI